MPCDSACSLCTGPTKNDCSACKVDKFNVPHYLQINLTSCSPTCPTDRYGDDVSKKC